MICPLYFILFNIRLYSYLFVLHLPLIIYLLLFFSSHTLNHNFYIKVITIFIVVTKMENQIEEKILEALENVEPWQRVPTSVDGAFLVKTPEKGGNKTIMVEINPLNERRTPMKRRGLFLRQSVELEKFLEVLENESISQLLKAVDDMSAKSVAQTPEGVKTLEI